MSAPQPPELPPARPQPGGTGALQLRERRLFWVSWSSGAVSSSFSVQPQNRPPPPPPACLRCCNSEKSNAAVPQLTKDSSLSVGQRIELLHGEQVKVMRKVTRICFVQRYLLCIW